MMYHPAGAVQSDESAIITLDNPCLPKVREKSSRDNIYQIMMEFFARGGTFCKNLKISRDLTF